MAQENTLQDWLDKFRQGAVEIIDDYFGGESISLGYDPEQSLFYVQRIDTIVGSYNETAYYEEQEFITILREYMRYLPF